MFDLTTLNSRCQANDRATCRYHSAYDAAQSAMAKGDMDGFLSAMSMLNTLRTSHGFDAAANEFVAPEPVKRKVPKGDIYAVKRMELIAKNIQDQPRPDSAAELQAWQIDKIENAAERMGMSYEHVLHDVLSNDTAWASVVVKNVSRQDYYETALVDYLNEQPSLKGTETEKLPKSGKRAKTLYNGQIVEGNKAKVKTLDMEVRNEFGHTVGYVIHKHTDDNGGGQDNQYHDVRHSLEHFHRGQGYFIAAVLDGEYYQSGRHSIDALRAEFKGNPDVFVGTYKEYVPWLKERQAGFAAAMRARR
jgi:hypothetical protein